MSNRSFVAMKIGDNYHVVPSSLPRQPQHLLMAGTGAFLGVLGLRQRGWMGWTLLATGGIMMLTGLTGSCPLQRLRGLFNRRLCDGGPSYANENPRVRQSAADDVEEASMQSFPASDAPARGISGP